MRLVVFDIDGTLVDSAGTIVACAQEAFARAGLAPPAPEAIRRIVGLSLPEAMARLLGRDDPPLCARIAEHYRQAFFARRAQPDHEEPLFPGAAEILSELAASGHLLGVATGKALRGVRAILDRHGLTRHFATVQTADRHPSKPHPAMLLAAMDETGSRPEDTVLVGDTTYDVEMARAAGVLPVGVRWGNHPPEELAAAGAAFLLDRFDQLREIVAR
ncbi:Pyrophosphatase PpaX [bacterium HR40]|nr:Pyrophosphatase PpaX [bacterium HR40]